MAAVYHVEMLGGLRVRHEDRLITRFRTRKTGDLLAYLACDPRRMHPREMLVEMLFPDLDPSARLGNLSKLISFLRTQFKAPGEGADCLIRADRHTVGLNVQVATTDVAAFETCLLEAQRALSDLTRAQALSDAVTLYRGPLLPELYYDWVLPVRERMAQQHLHALRTLVRLLAKTGETRRALDYAHQAVQADPLLEETHTDLMRLYVAVGQPEMALRQYRELEQRLSRELNIQPSNRARQLLTQLQEHLVSAPSPAHPAEIVTGPEPHKTSPAKTSERADSEFLRAAAPPPTSGTITFLMVDLTPRARTDAEAASETTSDELSRRLRAELRRHGGGQLRAEPGMLVAAFGRASDAGHGALAIRALFSREERTAQPRFALDTREVRLKDGEDVSRLLELALRLMTTAHEGQILCDEATAALLNRELSPNLQVEELGRYRLQEGTAPCRLFQLQDRDAPCAFPALRAPSGDPVHLPSVATRFFGREEELGRLQALLQDPAIRLITIMGPGGIGKTRLAREAAAHAAETAGQAVWWADLTDVTDADRLPEALLTTLHLPPVPGRSALELLIEAVQRQPMLLVLDNFEQLVEQGAGIVSRLIAQTSNVKLLLTSQQALELSGEQRLELSPLPVPEAPDVHRPSAPDAIDPEHLMRFPGVGLFVDRVQSLRLDFRLSRQNAEAIATLCARLEGIPLALEIAAARAQLLTPSQMLAQLEDRFAFLVSRKRDWSARHRTLRATVEWSFRLLSPELQQLLTRLSVFRGGWTIEAAAEVCGETGDVLGALEGLCNSSLIIAEEYEHSGIRFRMLETIREFAAELLEASDEAELIRTRHGGWCLTLAQAASRAAGGPEEQTWLDRLELEHDNLRAALTWGLKRTHDEEAGASSSARTMLRLCSTLTNFWWIRGYLDEGRAWCAAVLSMTGAAQRTEERASLLIGAGVLALRQGDYRIARTCYEECLSIWRELGYMKGVSYALNNLGMIAFDQGDYEAARVYYTESLSIKRELGDQKGIASTLNNMGMVAQSLGDFTAAETLYQEALSINREIGNRAWEANNLNNLGIVARFQSDYAQARVYYEESLSLRKKIGDRWGIAYSLHCLGHIDCLQGDYRSAEDSLRESLSIRKDTGDRPGIAQSLNALAELAAALYTASKNAGSASPTVDAAALGLRAAQLWGAAEALSNELGDVLPALEQEEVSRKIRMVREQLDTAAFAAAWSAGHAMAVDKAVAYALCGVC